MFLRLVAWTYILIYAILLSKTLDGKLWTEIHLSLIVFRPRTTSLVGLFLCSAKP